jgi:hypothetical protein
LLSWHGLHRDVNDDVDIRALAHRQADLSWANFP